MEHSRSPVPSPESPSAAGTVIPESPSVIVVHEARKQLPKARGGSSHMYHNLGSQIKYLSKKLWPKGPKTVINLRYQINENF